MPFFKFLVSILGLLLCNVANGQYTASGEASRIAGQCYLLTPDSTFGYGKLVSTRTINLNRSFTLQTEMYFGEQDTGGGGITFFFQSENEVNILGDTIYGIGNSAPSLNVEFDTSQDIELADPLFDHIAISKDGDFDHQSQDNLAGPVGINPIGNLEDGRWHSVKIEWNTDQQNLIVTLDCNELLNYQGDIINEIFSGVPNVFWGFSAGSFGAVNRQEICVRMDSRTDLLTDVTICKGSKTQINAIVGGSAYQWSPSDGLNADDIASPIATPDQSTTYLLEVETGFCDEVLNYTVNVDVAPIEAIVDIGSDTSLCIPETYTLDASSPNASAYKWSNGTLDSILNVSRTARYDVTVTFDDLCVAEDWAIIKFNDTPTVLLGNDTTICQKSNPFALKPIVNASVNYTWNNGSTADTLNINRAGFYSVIVDNACGEDEASIFINAENCQDFYLPNAFTPNADGFNDEMYPYTQDGDIDQITHFSIYNRWGNMVHLVENGEPNNRSLGWDGKTNGKSAAIGIYVYKLILRFRDGQEILIKGDFTLL